ncbi:MAG: MASE1 domain-containing protein, partial [Chloroflexales bacterium]
MLNETGIRQQTPNYWPLVQIVGVALLYFATARASLALIVRPVGVATVWPPSGLLVAILVLVPRRRWPALIGAVFLALVAVNLSVGSKLVMSAAFGLANCIESVVAALALTWHRAPTLTLTTLREVGLLARVVIGTNALTSLLGATVASVGLGLPFGEMWLVWWIADGLGMLLVGATILTWTGTTPARLPLLRRLEAAVILAVLAGVAGFTFNALPAEIIGPSSYLTFPFLLLMAVRFGPRGAAPASLLLAIIAVWCTAQGRGPFAATITEPTLRVLEVQAFLLVEGFSTLTLAALISERRQAARALQQANTTLETRVAERTAALVVANTHLQREIAERTQAEASLRESQERVRQALRLARSFTFEWDPANDGVVRSLNSSEILGLPSATATTDTGRGYFARIHPEDRARMVATVTGCTPSVPHYQICYRLIRPDGLTITLEETGQALFDNVGRQVRLFGIVNDVTARQQATERTMLLQQTTAALSAARLPEHVAAIFVAQGMATFAASAGIVVVPATDNADLVVLAVTGNTPSKYTPQSRIAQPTNIPLTEAFRTGHAVWIEHRDALLARYPQLEQMTTNSAFAGLPLVADNRIIGAFGISFQHAHSFSSEERGYLTTLADLCAQALDRARLFAAEQAARTTAEMAVQLRDQFLSIASHELKTPLTVLLGNAQLLQRHLSKQEQLEARDARLLTVLMEQTRRLDRLIGMLLDVSRIDTGHLSFERQPVDVRSLLRRLVDELQPTLVQHLVVLTLPDAPLTVLGDDLRLEQLFQNLIYNGVKYSPYGGEVAVQATATTTGVEVAVTDHGIGIPTAELPLLFGRFFRASNTKPLQISGLGIGLY